MLEMLTRPMEPPRRAAYELDPYSLRMERLGERVAAGGRPYKAQD